MGLSIKVLLDPSCDTPKPMISWCNDQGWRHILEWRWFWNNPSHDRSIQFHFEDPRHAHWFILRWGGEITGKI